MKTLVVASVTVSSWLVLLATTSSTAAEAFTPRATTTLWTTTTTAAVTTTRTKNLLRRTTHNARTKSQHAHHDQQSTETAQTEASSTKSTQSQSQSQSTQSQSQSSTESSTAALDPNTSVIPEKVEKRLDPFGGTGLYATAAIAAGETFFQTAPDTGVVFGATNGSALQDCVDDFCIGKNGFTESMSIGASLAAWRIFQEYHHHAKDTNGDGSDGSDDNGSLTTNGGDTSSTTTTPVVPFNAKTMRAAGISNAATEHAANLPWDKSRWQLPSLWPADILQQALTYGTDQVLLEEEELQPQLQQQSSSSSTDSQEEIRAALQEACEAVTSRVQNFQLAGDRLAEELGPWLRDEFGLTLDDDDTYLSLVCHQAMAMVFSRTFLHPPTGEMALLPWIDSANHNGPDANANLKNDDAVNGDDSTNNDNTTADAVDMGLKLVAAEPIAKGDEITITYGLEESGNIIAFAGYGFIPQGMAEASPVGRALQLTSFKGQELAQARIQQQDLAQAWIQQQQAQREE